MNNLSSPLILPGTPEFNLTLGAVLPPDWHQVAYQTNGDFAFIARAGSGLLEPVPWEVAEEYMEGGEWDERLNQIDEEEEVYELDYGA